MIHPPGMHLAELNVGRLSVPTDDRRGAGRAGHGPTPDGVSDRLETHNGSAGVADPRRRARDGGARP
jgi:hypothetical protein